MYDGDGLTTGDQYNADLKFDYIFVLKEILSASIGTVPSFVFFFLFHALGRSYDLPILFDVAFLVLTIVIAGGVIASYAHSVAGFSLRESVRLVHSRQTWSICPNFASRGLLLAVISLTTDLFFYGAYKPELAGQDPSTSFILSFALGLAACIAHVALAVALLSPATAHPEASPVRHGAYHTLAWLGPTLSCGAGWMAGDVVRPLVVAVLVRLPHLLQLVGSVIVVATIVALHVYVVLPILVRAATVATAQLATDRASVVHEVLSVVAEASAASVGWLAFHCTIIFTAAAGISLVGRVVWGFMVTAVVLLALPRIAVAVRRICAERRIRVEGSVSDVYRNALVEIYAEPCIRSIAALATSAAVLGTLATADALEGRPEGYVGVLFLVSLPIAIIGIASCAAGHFKAFAGGISTPAQEESTVLLELPHTRSSYTAM